MVSSMLSFAKVTVARFVELINALVSMVLTAAGMLRLTREVQFAKDWFPINSTPAGMVIAERFVQPEKVWLAIVLSAAGRVRPARDTHPWNA